VQDRQDFRLTSDFVVRLDIEQVQVPVRIFSAEVGLKLHVVSYLPGDIPHWRKGSNAIFLNQNLYSDK
ncbi:unnamed protein product, partial [Allacma fusca]